jgi:hypothetical protein
VQPTLDYPVDVVTRLRNGGTGGGGSGDDDINRKHGKRSFLIKSDGAGIHRDVLTYWDGALGEEVKIRSYGEKIY